MVDLLGNQLGSTITNLVSASENYEIEQFQDLIDQIDKDHNGQISYNEFKDALLIFGKEK